MPESYTLRYGVGGVQQAKAPTTLEPFEVIDAVNAVIDRNVLRCRPGVVVHDLGFDDKVNFQGAIYYNPAKGMSQISFGGDTPSIVFAAAGHKYRLFINDRSPENSEIEFSDVSGGLVNNENYHMAWMIQAENYVIVQDGHGPTWVWDGESDPEYSPGYNTEDKPASKLANSASIIAYVHGRIVQVIDGRKVLVGDIIHRDDLTSAKNILGMTEQVYWATGAFFSPPSGMGDVRAAAVLPLRNTIHGHSDLMLHCEDGVFSLDLTKYPRSGWPEMQLVKHAMLDTGAAGFYAITLYDSDQIFLSRHGIQTLRSAASESQTLGNAFRPISDPVKNYIDSDFPRYFLFASVDKFLEQKRLFCTTSHQIVDGRHRGGRGILTLNFAPVHENNIRSWEGLWTLPYECRLVNQLQSGLFEGRERLFAFGTGGDDILRFVEFSKHLAYDVLPDKSRRHIRWQIETRRDVCGDEMVAKSFENVTILFRDVIGKFGFKLYSRTSDSDWALYADGCFESEDDLCLVPTWKRDIKFDAGAPPLDMKRGRWIQFKLEMEGHAAVESIKVQFSYDRGGEGSGSDSGRCIVLCEERIEETVKSQYEYSEEP